LEHEYGALLSDTPTTAYALGRTLTSVVGVACLRTDSGVAPQLVSHVYGLLKAKDFPQDQTPGEKWLSSEDGVKWVIEVADAVKDVVILATAPSSFSSESNPSLKAKY